MTDAPPPTPTRPANSWLPWRRALHWQILLGLVIGAAVGYALGLWGVAQVPAGVGPVAASKAAAAAVTSSWTYLLAKLVGDVFINGLKLIIVPLVFSSIVLAVAGMGGGEDSGFGRLGLKTLAYYLCTSAAAILVGLTLVDLFSPGVGADGKGILVGQDISAFSGEQETVTSKVGDRSATDVLDVFRQMVPQNVFAAAGDNGQLLGLIVVALVVGYFLARAAGDGAGGAATVLLFTRGVYDLTIKITDLVLRLAPIGVLALLVSTVGEQYAKLAPDDRFLTFLAGILTFAGVAFAALAFHLLVTMPLILALVARVNPLRHFRAMAPALVTAFSTASSSATLPVTLECVEKRAGVSNRTSSFVLPLGATVNMDGTALYECVAAVFICQAFGVHLGFGQQFLVVVTALLTSIGVAGVPAASLVAIIIILQGVQNALPPGALPEGVTLVAGLGLLFVFDRPLDMCRTAVNIFSDSVGAVTVARSEGERTALAG